MIPVLRSEGGVVVEPELHDATLMGITFEADNVHFRFKTSGSTVVNLKLNDVRGLCLGDLFERNILFEVRILPLSCASEVDLRRVFHLTQNLDPNVQMLEKLQAEHFVLFEMDATLGADVQAVCRDATWQVE